MRIKIAKFRIVYQSFSVVVSGKECPSRSRFTAVNNDSFSKLQNLLNSIN